MAMQRIISGLKSPWAVGFSAFGVLYGGYNIIDMTQAGSKYELEADLTGKTYVVTGATSGIGKETAEELAKRNARVIMACRNRQKCVSTRRDIVLSTKNRNVFCRQVDLENFDSIKNFVEKINNGKYALDRIDGVINNAAVMKSTRTINKDGIESMLATNYLGTFLLNALLLPKLLEQNHPVRLVFLNTNLVNKLKNVDIENFNSEPVEGKKFDGYEVYKTTKLAEAAFALELADRLKGSNVSVLLADPGRTATNLEKELSHNNFFLSRWLVNFTGFIMGRRKVQKAVRPVLYAVADEEVDGKTKIFIDRERKEQTWSELLDDPKLREKLWLIAEKWTKYTERALELNPNAVSTTVATTTTPVQSQGRKWFYFF
ncbi:unnamed protein product [Bursaphelenchus xylophilus]|uniref:(pine wood nematode) hypothetical protein n=1 Tax=Bursaphelenchus xylophilus TaxID=6326 RepID=A0A1I7S5I1_BURXY|nr:unnamed protein product [Bursaphelenchus xylophilus]CAG9124732.1 unnamed protein product [Bursaphelenchus xylophilus]